MGLAGDPWMSVAARRWLRGAVVAGVLVAAMVALALWSTPPSWLAGPQRLAAAALRWTHEHLLTVGGVGLVVGILGLIVPFLVSRSERQGATVERRRVRDRQIMLARVRYRWINGLLDRSLAKETRIRLGLTRRPDSIIGQPSMIRHRKDQAELLPADTSITEMFDELGGGLLILGRPGSGKTTALLEFACHLLDRAEADERQPMPVVFNLSSWAARRPSLGEWLVDELATSYGVPRRIARQWVDANEVLPLLDGLDEVAQQHRTSCVEAINTFCRGHGLVRFVVCSRTGDYTELTALLLVEEAVEQQPLSEQQIRDYLAEAGGGLADVQAALESDETLWELLSCPLVLNIAALTYQDQPADELRTPGSPAQRLERLFTAYTERMLTHRPGRYTPARMCRWLGWLARSMRQRDQSEFHLDRLTSDWLPAKAHRSLAAVIPAIVGGSAIGLVFGLAGGLVPGLADGLFFGLFFGLFIGLLGRLGPGWREGVIFGLVGALIFGLVYGPVFGLASGLVGGLRRGGLAFGLLFGFAAGFARCSTPTATAKPSRQWTR